jgi:hypothetical protein
MTDNIIITGKYKLSDRFMQPDSTTFHRYDNLTLTQTDKKENINCPRFAFLKISKIRFAAHLLVAAFGGWASPTTSKRAAILSMHNII